MWRRPRAKAATPERSKSSVEATWYQPRCSGPTRCSIGMRTSWSSTSESWRSPARFSIGRISTPGVSIGRAKVERPRCFGAPGSVRAASQPMVARSAPATQVLRPLITYSSPSRTARVWIEARSEPAPGSE